ncbi:phosphatidylinositol transferase [Fusarium heterosporum]|uniref:Phosphatidylinositol transferase n=1 Tax=Fusarium heterosporum TaxID=42747 RepID=A0A8H5WQG7_FUSHE|nr:phosphatidylinositol transferase [Fusarium heterosporum]
MSQSSEPGTRGNLTVEQKRSLQEAWVHLLRLCGDKSVSHDAQDKTADFQQSLKNKSPEHFKRSLWESLLADHPDTSILRFLRARDWDVPKAVDMFVSSINWRDERQVQKTIIEEGEAVGLKKSLSVDEQAFMTQYRSGKSYVRGTDLENRPVYVIKVRLHDPHKQTAEAMETYVLHNIETLRMMAREPKDKVCLIFDLTGFGLRNMDFHVVKFLVDILETRYPETLGVVLVHNAPFVFWGVWTVIKHWLDPVVASKIHFTSGTKGLLKFIPKANLQKSYGGEDAWEYKYMEPVPTENERMQSEEKKTKIQIERQELIDQFDQLTVEWAALDGDAVANAEVPDRRDEVAQLLELNYWKLDPYIRSGTYYHRAGVVNRLGSVDFKAAR